MMQLQGRNAGVGWMERVSVRDNGTQREGEQHGGIISNSVGGLERNAEI